MQQNDISTYISTPDIQNVVYWDIWRHTRTSIREKKKYDQHGKYFKL